MGGTEVRRIMLRILVLALVLHSHSSLAKSKRRQIRLSTHLNGWTRGKRTRVRLETKSKKKEFIKTEAKISVRHACTLSTGIS